MCFFLFFFDVRLVCTASSGGSSGSYFEKKKGRKACADDVLSIGETFCCQDSFCAGRFKTTH